MWPRVLCPLLARTKERKRKRASTQHSAASWSLICNDRSQGLLGKEDTLSSGVSTSASEGWAYFCKAKGTLEIDSCQKTGQVKSFHLEFWARFERLTLIVKNTLQILYPHKEQSFPGNLNCLKYSSIHSSRIFLAVFNLFL